MRKLRSHKCEVQQGKKKKREREEEIESFEALIRNEGILKVEARVLLGPLVLVSIHPPILLFFLSF